MIRLIFKASSLNHSTSKITARSSAINRAQKVLHTFALFSELRKFSTFLYIICQCSLIYVLLFFLVLSSKVTQKYTTKFIQYSISQISRVGSLLPLYIHRKQLVLYSYQTWQTDNPRTTRNSYLMQSWTVRDRIPVSKMVSAHVPTSPGAHTVSCTMGTGSLSGG